VPEAPGPFRPVELLRLLVAHNVAFVVIGGIAATVRGSPYATVDVDITPRRDRANLSRLSDALRALDARVYVSPTETLRFEHEGRSLADAAAWNLATSFGGLDISFEPAGTSGYTDLADRATTVDVGGVKVTVAALEDVIRSKEAANREKDRVVLPTLRRLLDLESDERRAQRRPAKQRKALRRATTDRG
jgi:hypothetical protein